MNPSKTVELEIKSQIDDLNTMISECKKHEDWEMESVLLKTQNGLERTLDRLSD